MSETAQDRGRDWEHELAKMVGGELVAGSGNRFYARGDTKNGGQITWSAKHTDHASFSISSAIIDDARTMVHGPGSAAAGSVDVLAIRLGDGTMRADLDLMTLLAWIVQPPQIVPSTKTDDLRHTARTPSLLR